MLLRGTPGLGNDNLKKEIVMNLNSLYVFTITLLASFSLVNVEYLNLFKQTDYEEALVHCGHKNIILNNTDTTDAGKRYAIEADIFFRAPGVSERGAGNITTTFPSKRYTSVHPSSTIELKDVQPKGVSEIIIGFKTEDIERIYPGTTPSNRPKYRPTKKGLIPDSIYYDTMSLEDEDKNTYEYWTIVLVFDRKSEECEDDHPKQEDDKKTDEIIKQAVAFSGDDIIFSNHIHGHICAPIDPNCKD